MIRKTGFALLTFVVFITAAGSLWAQRGFTGLPSFRGEPTEWTFARLAYDAAPGMRSRWTVDYPTAERHFNNFVERLTRIDAHPLGHVVTLDDDEIFDYPWLYAVEVGSWGFSDSQAARLREYLLRGGFLMVDDFHGEREWQVFMNGLRKVFPNRPMEDIPADDVLYQMPYEISERLQVPGPNYMWTGLTYERIDGVEAHWRGIRDDKGRFMVVASFNVDYGDGWELADNPQYPEVFTRQAYEVGINYLIYSMTH